MNFVGHWATSTTTARIVTHTPSSTSRMVRRPHGTLLLFGQFLGTGRTLEDACDTALRTNAPEAAATWPGCYSVALITPSGVTLLTDPVGQFPFFVTEKASEIWFGTRSTDVAGCVRAP